MRKYIIQSINKNYILLHRLHLQNKVTCCHESESSVVKSSLFRLQLAFQAKVVVTLISIQFQFSSRIPNRNAQILYKERQYLKLSSSSFARTRVKPPGPVPRLWGVTTSLLFFPGAHTAVLYSESSVRHSFNTRSPL